MTLRNVPKGYTLEQQRQELNLVAADLDTAVDGNQTFGGNKEFTGDVTFAANVYFGDNDKLIFGDDNDLQIFYDGSFSRIWETGDLGLEIRTNQFFLTSQDGVENIIRATENASVELFYDNSKKIETTSTGVTVSGDVVIDIGTENAKLYGSSEEFYIRNTDGTGAGGGVNIQGRSGASLWTGTGQLAVAADSNGAGVLYYQSLKKLEATTSGITVTGSVLVDNNLYVNSGYPGIGAQILETGAYRARVDDVASVVQDALVLGRFQNLDSFVVKANGNLVTIGNIEAASFVKTGGTSAQFLKADGSVDTATYLTGEVNDLTAAVTWANVPDVNITQSSVTQHQAALSITESQISDLQSYLTSYTETDPIFTASEAASITSTDTTNWDTAYSWGDHASAGYLTVAAGGTAPTTATDTGTPGEIRYDADFIYICIATNTWKRAAIATW